ncbi:MAG: prephenate dehydrogenase/arogenate dehydrogenase family protein [Pirellulaceae bacterium]
MPQFKTVAIIGVGLIGGSIGLAIRARHLAERVIGIGQRQTSLDRAVSVGAIDEGTTDLAAGVREAELIVICTPVELIVDLVLQTAAACPQGAIITDAGSTKARIVAEVEKLELPGEVRFVGSHPLAGSEKTGPEHAKANLLENRVVVVTPGAHSTEPAEQRVCQFWESLGAKVVQMTPQRHDEAVAYTSHLTHLVASLLAAATPEEFLPVAASGWEDTTRVAAGDVQLWQQIVDSNRSHILKAVGNFERLLNSLRVALETGDDATLVKLLEEGKSRRDIVGS